MHADQVRKKTKWSLGSWKQIGRYPQTWVIGQASKENSSGHSEKGTEQSIKGYNVGNVQELCRIQLTSILKISCAGKYKIDGTVTFISLRRVFKNYCDKVTGQKKPLK